MKSSSRGGVRATAAAMSSSFTSNPSASGAASHRASCCTGLLIVHMCNLIHIVPLFPPVRFSVSILEDAIVAHTLQMKRERSCACFVSGGMSFSTVPVFVVPALQAKRNSEEMLQRLDAQNIHEAIIMHDLKVDFDMEK